MARISRRRFLQASAAASTALASFTIAGTKASGRVLGANDTIRVAVCGINGRGGSHIGELQEIPHVQVTHLVDPDSRLFESRSKAIADRTGNTPICVQDVREVLEGDSVDAISIATCNHWHALMAIWACQAGKDVYVEKPLSHNVFEGRQLVAAAKKYGRVVQHGTQQRSSQRRANEIAAVQSGKYGRLLISKGYCCKPRWSIGTQPVETPPATLDWNIWLGPAPMQDFHRNLVHYNWHWFWDTGNGDTGNQGVHEIGCGPLGDPRRHPADGSLEPGRPLRLSGSGPDAEHAIDRICVRGCAAAVRDARSGRPTSRLPADRAQRVLHDRGHDHRRQVPSCPGRRPGAGQRWHAAPSCR